MSKGKFKLLMALGGAAVVGGYALFRKLVPIRQEVCPYCQATGVYALKDERGFVMAQACLTCGARYRVLEGQAERIDEATWDALVESSHSS